MTNAKFTASDIKNVELLEIEIEHEAKRLFESDRARKGRTLEAIKSSVRQGKTLEVWLTENYDFRLSSDIYHAKKFHSPVYEPKKTVIDIGCFGAIRPMKNNYQQALAAIEFAERKGKRLRFHVNSSRVEQSGDNVLKNLKALFENSPHDLVEHPWMKHREFLHTASKMDIGMQVSFSESFNIVTADFVTAGVPIVASDDIEWMPNLLKCTPTSHKAMIRRLNFAYNWRGLSKWLQSWSLRIYNVKAKLTWLAALK